MAQQTAVEWLAEQFDNIVELYPSEWEKINNAIQQAKAMEKQQIIKAVYDSMGTNFDPNMGRAELYYEETFNTRL